MYQVGSENVHFSKRPRRIKLENNFNRLVLAFTFPAHPSVLLKKKERKKKKWFFLVQLIIQHIGKPSKCNAFVYHSNCIVRYAYLRFNLGRCINISMFAEPN